jgi:hypothetical protein
MSPAPVFIAGSQMITRLVRDAEIYQFHGEGIRSATFVLGETLHNQARH